MITVFIDYSLITLCLPFAFFAVLGVFALRILLHLEDSPRKDAKARKDPKKRKDNKPLLPMQYSALRVRM